MNLENILTIASNFNWLGLINVLVIVLGVPFLIKQFVKIGRKLEKLDSLERTSEKIKFNLKAIGDFLVVKNKFNPSELQAYSPFRLTDAGEKFIKDIGFDVVFENNKNDFFSYIKEEKPELKYDVEKASIKSIYTLSDKPYMDFLKVYFYNHPNRSMEDTAPTLGVFVRDKYLLENTQITQ